MTMKALVYTGTQEVEYRDENKPTPGPNQALIEVAATAICGSDMHAYHGLDERRVPPLILGHEVAGKLISGPAHLMGQHVVINPLMTCGHCRPCISGRANLCSAREIIGMRLAGAYAQYLVVDQTNLLLPPPTLEPWVACLTEPTATALHAVALVERVSYRPLSEQRCLVIGGGAIGLLTALILAAKGCSNIDLAETNALRRTTVEQQAVAQVFDPITETVPSTNGYDVVFDCVGAGVTRAMASEHVAAGGIISHVGLQNSHEGLDIRRITLQEITLLGNYCYTPADMQAALDMLAAKRLGDLKWVQLRPLSEGAQAFSDLHHGRAAAAKIVLQPDHQL
jgi:threonine dehydrogenase-like Zn-dependent dehydrogenase|tara:strand:+ start:460 stop:1476 length:1017 start_codon:yes stop_codon:yes gene_type:complete